MDYTTVNCPFCLERNTREIIAENDLAYAAFDIFPVSEGHCLVITKRHVSNFFETTSSEKEALFSLVNELRLVLEKKYNPAGFNIGININEAAGQTVPHVHIHVIPRYSGDVENPRGGVRHVIPGRGNY
ncbi:HIT family protein [Draconibacterium orientale]|uniref:HIT family protein n=1 Tax=Draconibacterium orientale TaxID=1168034 RepID=UPI002A0A5B6E|nr:HIT family protein [Draconibacterium orientale]